MTKVVQVSNIAPQATKDQMSTLFSYVGKIEDIRLYPTVRDVAFPVQSRICYVKFFDSACVGVAQHLTNTVFIDRAIIVIPHSEGDIPDEAKVVQLMASGIGLPGLVPPGGGVKMPPHVVNQLQGTPPNHYVVTVDPHLAEAGLPLYPSLPANLDGVKIDEIRRTLVVTNVDSEATAEDLIDHFTDKAGEVKYIRLGKCDSQSGVAALVEFTEQPSVLNGLRLNGSEFRGNVIDVTHSTTPITKPQAKSNEAAQREIEEAMRKVRETQSMISSSIDPGTVLSLIEKDSMRSRSRSRSHSRRRSRSRSRRHRSRSRSRRHRSRSRSRRRSHSRSSLRLIRKTVVEPEKRRRRSRSHRRSRSKRSTSRSRKKRSRSRSRSRRKKDKEKRREKDEERKKEKSSSPIAKSPGSISPKPEEKIRSISPPPLPRKRRRSITPPRKKSKRRSRSISPRKKSPRRRSRSPGRRRSRSPRKSRRNISPEPRRRKASMSPSPRRRYSPRRSPSRREKKVVDDSVSKGVSRDYDAEEQIYHDDGLDEAIFSRGADDMDISNSP